MTRYRDLITGFLSVALAALLFGLTFGVKDFSSVRLGPDFVPRITAVFLGLFGVILIVQGVKSRVPKQRGDAAAGASTKKEKNHGALLSFLLMAAYIALLDSLGFIIATSVYLFLQMIILAHRSHRRYVLFALISLGTSTLAYYLFVGFFQVMIPAGILG